MSQGEEACLISAIKKPDIYEVDGSLTREDLERKDSHQK